MAFSSTPGSFQKLPTIDPQQQQIKSALTPQLLQTLQGLGSNKFDFQPIAQQRQRQFAQQTLPSIAERFTSMGGAGTGALSSPAFASQIGAAGVGLQNDLAALQSQYALQQQGQQQNLLQMLLGGALDPSFQYGYQPEQIGSARQFFSSFLPAAAQAAGQLGGAYMTGGASLLPQLLSRLGSQQQQQPQYQTQPGFTDPRVSNYRPLNFGGL